MKECPGSLWSLHFDDIKYEGRAFLHVKVKNHLDVSRLAACYAVAVARHLRSGCIARPSPNIRPGR